MEAVAYTMTKDDILVRVSIHDNNDLEIVCDDKGKITKLIFGEQQAKFIAKHCYRYLNCLNVTT